MNASLVMTVMEMQTVQISLDLTHVPAHLDSEGLD